MCFELVDPQVILNAAISVVKELLKSVSNFVKVITKTQCACFVTGPEHLRKR